MLLSRGLSADALEEEEEEAADTGDFFFPEVAGGVTGRDGFFPLDVPRPDCRAFIHGEERRAEERRGDEVRGGEVHRYAQID